MLVLLFQFRYTFSIGYNKYILLNWMITNFQLRPRKCKYHNLPQEFICMHKDCQYIALLCSDCTRQNHGCHLHDIRSVDSFIESFRQKVKFYQTQFDKEKVVINVKEIVKTKLNELDQVMNELLVMVVKYLEKEKETVREKLMGLEEKYEVLQAEYRKNLEARFDCLEYLAAYKNSPQALEARLLCSSEWGIVALKNSLTEIRNLSINQARDVNVITENILQEGDKILKQQNFLYSLKQFIKQYSSKSPRPPTRNNTRTNSFIEKSFISPTVNPPIITSPKTSRVIEEQRQRTFSLSNLYRPVSNQQITVVKQTSMEKIPVTKQLLIERLPVKIASENSLDNVKYMRGLRKLRVENVIIR